MCVKIIILHIITCVDMFEMNNIQDYAVYTEHYTDNIQNLCRLIYVTLYGKFPSLVQHVQPLGDTYDTHRQCGHKPWIFYTII